MKWDEFDKMVSSIDTWKPRSQVNVECPKCGSKLFRRNDIVLTSYPAQYQYECDACGWVGYSENAGDVL